MVKVTEAVYKKKFEYVGFKRKDSIKYAKVECFKRVAVKDEEDRFDLLETKNMIVTKFNLSKLKGDSFRVEKILEWDRYGLI